MVRCSSEFERKRERGSVCHRSTAIEIGVCAYLAIHQASSVVSCHYVKPCPPITGRISELCCDHCLNSIKERASHIVMKVTNKARDS